jgi:peroxiredoxin Q/BCP
MGLPKVGNLAPNFKLFNQDENEISLKDYIGQNVVLYFYPKAMTPGCTTQACGIRDFKKEFAKLKTVVLAVSPDAPSRLVKFTENQELNFTLLSDPEHKVAEAYGVWAKKKMMGREYMGVVRTTFIIDKTGKLKFIMDKVNTKTHHEDVVALIKDLL